MEHGDHFPKVYSEALKDTHMHKHTLRQRSWQVMRNRHTDEADETLFVLWCCVCASVFVCVCFLTIELRASPTFDLWYSWTVSEEGTHSSGKNWSNNLQPENWKTERKAEQDTRTSNIKQKSIQFFNKINIKRSNRQRWCFMLQSLFSPAL